MNVCNNISAENTSSYIIYRENYIGMPRIINDEMCYPGVPHHIGQQRLFGKRFFTEYSDGLMLPSIINGKIGLVILQGENSSKFDHTYNLA